MSITDDQLREIIINAYAVSEAELEVVLEFAKSSGTPLYDALLKKNVMTDGNLGKLIADYLKLPFINLAESTLPDEV